MLSKNVLLRITRLAEFNASGQPKPKLTSQRLFLDLAFMLSLFGLLYLKVVAVTLITARFINLKVSESLSQKEAKRTLRCKLTILG